MKTPTPDHKSQLITNLKAGDSLDIAGPFVLHFGHRIREKLGGVAPEFTFLKSGNKSPSHCQPVQEVPCNTQTRRNRK